MNILQFRQAYPQYADLDDDTIVQKLHDKFHPDEDPTEFRSRFLGRAPVSRSASLPDTVDNPPAEVANDSGLSLSDLITDRRPAPSPLAMKSPGQTAPTPVAQPGVRTVKQMIDEQELQIAPLREDTVAGSLVKRSGARLIGGVLALPDTMIRAGITEETGTSPLDKAAFVERQGKTEEELTADTQKQQARLKAYDTSPIGAALKMEDVQKRIKQYERDAVAALPADWQRATELTFVERDEQGDLHFGEGATDPKWYGVQAIDMGVLMAPGIGTAGLAARGSYAAKFAETLAKLSTQKVPQSVALAAARKAGQEAAIRAAVIAGGASEGGIAGGQQMQQVREIIDQLDEETMMQYEPYKVLRSRGLSHDAARDRVATDQAVAAGASSAIVTGMTGAPLNGMMGRWFSGARILGGKTPTSLLGKIGERAVTAGKVGLLEGGQEFVQEGFDQLSQNLAEGPITGQAPWSGVLENALTGGWLGFLMGGAEGGIAGPEGPDVGPGKGKPKTDLDARAGELAVARENYAAVVGPGKRVTQDQIDEAKEAYEGALATFGREALQSGALPPDEQQKLAEALGKAPGTTKGEGAAPISGKVREAAPKAPAGPGVQEKPVSTSRGQAEKLDKEPLSEFETSRKDALDRVANADTIEGEPLNEMVAGGLVKINPQTGRPVLLPAGKRQRAALAKRETAVEAAEEAAKPTSVAKKPQAKSVHVRTKKPSDVAYTQQSKKATEQQGKPQQSSPEIKPPTAPTEPPGPPPAGQLALKRLSEMTTAEQKKLTKRQRALLEREEQGGQEPMFATRDDRDEKQVLLNRDGEVLREGQKATIEGRNGEPDEEVEVISIEKPRSAASSGRVNVRYQDGREASYFPGVIDAEWKPIVQEAGKSAAKDVIQTRINPETGEEEQFIDMGPVSEEEMAWLTALRNDALDRKAKLDQKAAKARVKRVQKKLEKVGAPANVAALDTSKSQRTDKGEKADVLPFRKKPTEPAFAVAEEEDHSAENADRSSRYIPESMGERRVDHARRAEIEAERAAVMRTAPGQKGFNADQMTQDLLSRPGQREAARQTTIQNRNRVLGTNVPTGFEQDNPAARGESNGKKWLAEKVANAEEDMATAKKRGNKTGGMAHGIGGATTAWARNLDLPTDAIANIPGTNGEQRKPGEDQFDRLMENVRKEGFNQEKSPILIAVNHRGEAFIDEGNTRVAVAKAIGQPTVRAEVRYWNGGEMKDGPLSPAKLKQMTSNEPMFAAAPAELPAEGEPHLAPNGKPSKLSRAQWQQVRTPEFKNWFGDWEKFALQQGGVWNDDKKAVSKAVDPVTQEPAVVYHGSKAGGFDEFRAAVPRTAGPNGAAGVFFSSDASIASTYSGTQNELDLSTAGNDNAQGPGLYPAFLNLRNPNETNFEGANWDGSRSGQYSVVTNVDEDGFREIAYDDNGRGYGDRDWALMLAMKLGIYDNVVPAEDHYTTTNGVVREAIKYKNDGAIIRDVVDNGGEFDVLRRSDVYVAFHPNQIKSATQNSGAFDPNDDRMAFAAAPLFYSALTRAGENAKMTKGTAEQWYGALKNTPGVKQEELDWSGVKEWLGDRKGITKEEVTGYLRANELTIDEQELVPPKMTLNKESPYYQTLRKRSYGLDFIENMESGQIGTPRDALLMLDNTRELVDALMEAHPELKEEPNDEPWAYTVARDLLLIDDQQPTEKMLQEFDAKDAKATKFSQHQLPGGENYKMLLIQLPDPTPRATLAQTGGAVEQAGDNSYIAYDVQGNPIGMGDTPEAAREHAQRINPEQAIVDTFRTSHFPDDRNVVAHVRLNERTDTEGRSYIFLETVQSDWHQEGRKLGYSKDLPAEGLPPGYKVGHFTGRPRNVSFTVAPSTEWGWAFVRESDKVAVGNQTGFKDNGFRTPKEAIEAARADFGMRAVPEAPFKTTWPELVMKRLVRYAAENGFDGIGWTTGAQQAERWLNLDDMDDGDTGGMGGFYDEILPHAAGKVGKKYGAKPNNRIEFEVPNIGRFGAHGMLLTPELKTAALGGFPMFAADSTIGSISFVEAKAAVVEAERQLGVPIAVVATQDELPPSFAAEARSRSLRVQGVYDKGKVWLVANNHKSAAAAQNTYYHEVVGHKGLRAMLGGEYNNTMDRIYADFPEEVRKAAKRGRISDLALAKNQRMAAEEAVAYAAGALLSKTGGKDQRSVWRKMVDFVRAAIMKRRPFMRMNRNDIDALIYRARDAVRRQAARDRAGQTAYEEKVETARDRGTPIARPDPMNDGPLLGMPTKGNIPGVGDVAIGPHAPARAAAQRYKKQAGIYLPDQRVYHKVNPATGKRIANAYQNMKHDPLNPRVKAAYDAMVKETLAQYQVIKDTGLKVEFIPTGQNPYAASPRMAIEDVKKNNHLWVFPSDDGFGGTDPNAEYFQNNPLLAKTDEYVGRKQLLVNDVFRIVHDYFGHIKEGNGFRHDGEENAWRSHAMMYTPLARAAMTSETRGQNSWLNWGPHGDKNRNAKSAETIYAEQKIGLLPAEFWNPEPDENMAFALGEEEVDPPHYPSDEPKDGKEVVKWLFGKDVIETWRSGGSALGTAIAFYGMATGSPIITTIGIGMDAAGGSSGYDKKTTPGGPRRSAKSLLAKLDRTDGESIYWGKSGQAMRRRVEAALESYPEKEFIAPHELFAKMFPEEPEAAFAVADEVADTIHEIAGLLTEDERTNLNRTTAQKLVDLFNNLPDEKERGAVALAGSAARGWYRDSAETLADIFGADSPRFAALLAALSPQVDVAANLSNAIGVWRGWVKAGRPVKANEIKRLMASNLWGATDRKGMRVGVLPSWINNTVRALSTDTPESVVLSGPKVSSFAANLRNEVYEVTLDSWMAAFDKLDGRKFFAGSINRSGTGPGKRHGYLAVAARIRQTAQYLTKQTGETWTPAEVQETIWSWTKTLSELAAKYGSMSSAEEIIKDGELTNELVNATTNFATLFALPEHQETLRNLGYGERLDRADARAKARGGARREAPTLSGADQQRVLTSARRLDELRKESPKLGVMGGARMAAADQDDMAFSVLGGNTGDPDLDRFMAGIGDQKRTLNQWWQDVTENLSAKAQMAVFDDLYGIKRAGDVAGISAADVGFKNAHLARNAAELTQALIEYGAPVWNKDGGHMVANVEGGQGLIDILRPLGGKVNLWSAWMVARRASRLMGEGREKHFDKAGIAAALKLGKDHPEFEVVAKRYAEFQKKVLDFAQEAGVIDPDSRALWENADYIPFYRIIENGQVQGPNGGGMLGKVRNQIIKLRGGKANIGDPLENIARNWHSLMDASLKAQAARTVVDALNGSGLVTKAPQIEITSAMVPRGQIEKFIKENPSLVQHLRAYGVDPNALPDDAFRGIQKMLAVQPPTGEDIISVWRNGKREYWHVHDDLLFESLMNVNKAAWGPLMEFFRFPKRFGTAMITTTASFGVKNFFRDMLHSFIQGTVGGSTTIVPVLDSVKGAISQLRMDASSQALLAGGGSFTHGYIRAGDTRGAASTIRRALRKTNPGEMVLNTPAKMWRFYRDLLNASENAHRVAVYNKMVAKGASRLDAMYEARDLLDFGKRGNNVAVQFLTQSVMFMNARAQGLYRLGRAPGGKARAALSIALRGSLYMMGVLMLYGLQMDDDRYKALTDADKANYLHFFDVFAEGDHYRLPVPFEVGTIFGTIPLAIAEAIHSDEPDKVKQSAELLSSAFGQTLNLSPEIQALWPIVELAINRDTFTKSPILTMGDAAVLPEEQDDPRLSPTIRAAAQGMPGFAPEALRSPKQLNHLVRGYTGPVLDYGLFVTDAIAGRLMGEPEGAEKTLRDYPDVKAFVQTGPARMTKYGNAMFEVAEAADRVAASIHRLEQQGTPEALDRINQLQADNAGLLAARDSFRKAATDVVDLRKAMRQIQLDDMLTPAQKRSELDTIQNQINEIAFSVWDIRPGGKLNPDVAVELMGKDLQGQVDVLLKHKMPATAEALESME